MNTELQVTGQLRGFARRLVAEGLLDEQSALKATDSARQKGTTVLDWLIREQELDADLLASAASIEYGVPQLNVQAMDLSQAPVSLVDEQLILKHKALPLYLRGNSLFIALADPTDHTIIDEISFSSGFHVEPILVAAHQLDQAIERALSLIHI